MLGTHQLGKMVISTVKGCNLKCSHSRLLYRTPLWYWTLYVRIRCIPVSRLCRQLQTRVKPPVYASSEKSHSRSNVHQNGSCNILPDSAIIMRKSARMFRLTSCRTEPFSPEFVPRKPNTKLRRLMGGTVLTRIPARAHRCLPTPDSVRK